MSADRHDSTVHAVYELRKAAVEHGKAIADVEQGNARKSHDRLIATTLTLETKTAAVLDECAENAEDAVEKAAS